MSFGPKDNPVTAGRVVDVRNYEPLHNPMAYRLICKYCGSERMPVVADCKNCGASKGTMKKL